MSKLLDSILPQPRTTTSGQINIPNPTDPLSSFSPPSLDLLTQLLSLPAGTLPSAPWLQDQTTLISTLPPCLLHPKSSGLIPRLAASLTSLRLGRTSAELCATHKPLNPYLIRKLFLELTAECSTRIESLASAPVGEVPTTIQAFTRRMQKLNSIWMQPELYRQAYQVQPCAARYERIESGCEACILASVGGNRSIVRDLHAAIISRRKKHRSQQGWIDFIQAWGSWTREAEALRDESRELGREIARYRKGLQTLRRAARRERSGGARNALAKHDEEQRLRIERDEEREGEIGDEIIDFYADMISRSTLARASSITSPGAQAAESIHAAFRDTMKFTSGGYFQNASRPVLGNPSIYSRSEYNTSQISQHGAEERASAYRKLVGREEGEDEDSDEEDEDERPQFTDPFADPRTMNHRPAYRGSSYENSRASLAPPSPRTTRHEKEPKHKAAPHHRRPELQVNPFVRNSHVAHPESGKRVDRETRFSDFMQ